MRSPTAEQVFATWSDVETDSAGTHSSAEAPLSAEHIEWADIIFVMERRHQTALSEQFGRELKGKKVVCLNIPDKYPFMDPELVALLEQRVGPYLE